MSAWGCFNAALEACLERVVHYMWETFLFFPRRIREGPSVGPTDGPAELQLVGLGPGLCE